MLYKYIIYTILIYTILCFQTVSKMESEWKQNGIKMEPDCLQLNCAQSNYDGEARICGIFYVGISAKVTKTLMRLRARVAFGNLLTVDLIYPQKFFFSKIIISNFAISCAAIYSSSRLFCIQHIVLFSVFRSFKKFKKIILIFSQSIYSISKSCASRSFPHLSTPYLVKISRNK